MDALQKLKQKLKSQTGASITFALLLFLVCAVVGSAVLVAGTAAAGRMSKIAEMDQRYYAVNSAARFLIDTVEEETVEVKKVITTKDDGTAKTEYILQTADTESTSLADVTYDSFPKEAAFQLGYLSEKTLDSAITNKYTLTGSVEGTSDSGTDAAAGDSVPESIQVGIDETINPDGSLMFDIYKGNPPYTLRMVFALEKQEQRSWDELHKTETITSKLNWKLRDIETVVNRTPLNNGSGTESGEGNP